MATWKDYPRTKDKLAIVGFHEATRDAAPFDNPDYEIWSVNEEYNYDWLKRTDRHFQLHPRWDFTRSNNLNDPNHFAWLKNQTSTCMLCKGAGVFKLLPNEPEKKCPACENGTFYPQEHKRGNIPIYMQKAHADIPNSIKFPLEEIWQKFQPGSKPYFTSSCAYQLGLAMLMGYKKIEMYGYDMGSTTEYHYQKANFEYWIGLAHGHGFDVTLPGSSILTGELYGYDNMKTGFRQQLEMRRFNLEKQFRDTKTACTRLEAKVSLLETLDFPGIKEKLNEAQLKLDKQNGILNFINGAMIETENLTTLYGGYFLTGQEQGDGVEQDAYTENQVHVNSVYILPEEENG